MKLQETWSILELESFQWQIGNHSLNNILLLIIDKFDYSENLI